MHWRKIRRMVAFLVTRRVLYFAAALCIASVSSVDGSSRCIMPPPEAPDRLAGSGQAEEVAAFEDSSVELGQQ